MSYVRGNNVALDAPFVTQMMANTELLRRRRTRRPIARAVFIFLMITATSLATATGARASESAVVRVLSGTPFIGGPDGLVLRRGVDGMPLRSGDRLQTPERARAQVDYFDGSITRLDALTVLDMVLVESAGDSSIVESFLQSGRTYNIIKGARAGAVIVRVPGGRALASGAEFALDVDGENVTCLLYTSPSPRDRG